MGRLVADITNKLSRGRSIHPENDVVSIDQTSVTRPEQVSGSAYDRADESPVGPEITENIR
jgi:hypothetical protein